MTFTYDVHLALWSIDMDGGGFTYTRTHQVQYGATGETDMYQTVIEPSGSVTRTKEFSGAQAGLHVDNIAVSSDDPATPLDSIYTLNIVGPRRAYLRSASARQTPPGRFLLRGTVSDHRWPGSADRRRDRPVQR
jgi:hypothetical protein